ncbi:MAG: alpha/beta hydrolase [Pseudomonadota bacterium]
MIAVEAAAHAPERVTQVITMGGYVDGRTRRNQVGPGSEAILQMVREGWDKQKSTFMDAYLMLYFPTAKRDQIEALSHMLQNSAPLRSEEMNRDFMNNHSVAPLLDKVQAPTLVIHSRDDGVHPLTEGQKMARGIAGAELLILETSNHYPLPGEPAWDVMREGLRRFLGG